MKIPFVDLKAQYKTIKTEVDKAIQSVITDTAFINGKYVNEFENNFASALNINHCIGVGNGTDAITIALKSLNIGNNDEVITAANSFFATSEAITNAGAKVVFVDCLPETYTIDYSKIEEKITNNTKAIIPVHLYGYPAEMDKICEIAKKHNLFIVEDSAQAHLVEFNINGKWKKIGSYGDIATFSFYPGKNLGAYGDAGALVTNDEEIARKIRMYANHGRISKYDHEFEGFNSRMDGIQGAILNVKLKYLNEWTGKRQNAAKKYSELLSNVKDVVLPVWNGNAKPVFHLYVIRSSKRDELKQFLIDNGISCGIHYPITLPNLTAYKHLGHIPEDFPLSTKYQDEILSLPIFPEITDEQIQYVCDTIKEFFK